MVLTLHEPAALKLKLVHQTESQTILGEKNNKKLELFPAFKRFSILSIMSLNLGSEGTSSR